MKDSPDGAAFQESVVHLHEYLIGLGFLAAAKGLVEDIKDAVKANEGSAIHRLKPRQRKLQEDNSVLLRELLMMLTGDHDGQAVTDWVRANR